MKFRLAATLLLLRTDGHGENNIPPLRRGIKTIFISLRGRQPCFWREREREREYVHDIIITYPLHLQVLAKVSIVLSVVKTSNYKALLEALQASYGALHLYIFIN